MEYNTKLTDYSTPKSGEYTSKVGEYTPKVGEYTSRTPDCKPQDFIVPKEFEKNYYEEGSFHPFSKQF